MKIVANNAIPRPEEAINTYFHAASVAPSVSSRATSSADTTVVISTAIHSSANPLTSGAASIDHAKALRPT